MKNLYKSVKFKDVDFGSLNYNTRYVCKIGDDYKALTPDQILRLDKVDFVLIPYTENN